MDREKLARELVKMAKALTAGCEKLPEGPMRDNCEKKKEEGKKKESSRKRLTAGRDVVFNVSVPSKLDRKAESDLENLAEEMQADGEIGNFGIGDPRTSISLILRDLVDLAGAKSKVESVAGKHRGIVTWS